MKNSLILPFAAVSILTFGILLLYVSADYLSQI